MNIRFRIEHVLGFVRLCNAITFIQSKLGKQGPRTTFGATRRDREKLLDSFLTLPESEQEDLLIAAYQCAHAISPILDAEIRVEAVMPAVKAEWN